MNNGNGTQWINQLFRSCQPVVAIRSAYRVANSFSVANQKTRFLGNMQVNHFKPWANLIKLNSA